ncbi:MAG: hypothetical protein K0R38_7180 [Polyangiaceae bacterium]|jgi:hypothetical protein|nr:hypothetical protein [Polyangiaceae bacterium]
MLKKLTATLMATAALAGCSVENSTPEDFAALQQSLNTCGASGLEWKPFVAHLAYDAAEDFGRWEFTTDLQLNGARDRLQISPAGYSQCASRGRTGCPAVTAGLSAQEGTQDVFSSNKLIVSPGQIRGALVGGFLQQKQNEDYIGYITDSSESSQYQTLKSPTRTGLPHTVTLTNCAVTIYSEAGFTGKSQCLRTGSYRQADLKIGDNTVTSIKVRPGMKVTVYEHDAFAGASNVQTADMAGFGPFNDRTSSIIVSDNTGSCSAIDTYKVNVSSGQWTDIRAKLVTLGYMRGNDILDVRLDLANQTIDVDPFNVDFVPPSQVGGTAYGVAVKSEVAETWRSTDDPAPAIFPVGASCKKKPYGHYSFFPGIVRSMGAYRYCNLN